MVIMLQWITKNYIGVIVSVFGAAVFAIFGYSSKNIKKYYNKHIHNDEIIVNKLGSKDSIEIDDACKKIIEKGKRRAK